MEHIHRGGAKFAFYRLYRIGDGRYVEIMDSPFNAGAADPRIGATIMLSDQLCFTHRCSLLVQDTMREAEARIEDSAPWPVARPEQMGIINRQTQVAPG